MLAGTPLLIVYSHLSSPPVFSVVHVVRSNVLCFVDRCLTFSLFSFDHRVVCPLVPLRYLQTLIK